jgi:protocatechuate 4,5-dioxygenase beta chain
MIGDDQGDMFDQANNPTFAIYTGDEPAWGRSARDPFGTPAQERTKLVFRQHGELARHLLGGLVERGFDLANLGRFEPRGNPARGISHMVGNLVPEVDPNLEIPLVCVFVNEYYPPLPSAARCARLGEAIADVLRDRPERVAIYASGGLSHYPGMYNAGWIDQPLDRWILERLEKNDLDALEHLFTFDSDNLRSGTGEVRAWISAAAAMQRPARIVDYVPAHCTQTGCGFVYWPPGDQGS